LVSLLVLAAQADEGAEAAAANPVRRVVSMLQKMQQRIAAEGVKEKELYEKFNCWCQTGGSDLKQSIESANTRLPQLASSITEGEANLARLKLEVEGHQKDRADAKQAMAEASAIREKEAAAFAKEKAENDSNIAALTGAISAISKGMGGAFLQTKEASVLRRITTTIDMTDVDRDLVASFLSQGSSGQNSYAPQSGEIVGILKQLSDTMQKDLADLVAQEKAAKASYGELMAAKKKQVDASAAAIEKKLARIGELGVEIVNMKNDLSDTQAALMEDTKYLANLEGDCKSKSDEWAERQTTRAAELVALADTIKILNDDDALELFKKTLPSPSLVQLSTNMDNTRRRALALIQDVQKVLSRRERSPLEFVAMALSGKKLNFDKVIKLVDELVSTLNQEQIDDDNKKDYCQVQLDQVDDKKKVLEHEVSDLEASIEEATGGIATLTDDIKALGDGIVALDKSVAEATEQRKQEHEDFSELMASDAAAKQLLGLAKNRLNKFYNSKLYKAPPKRELSEEERIAENIEPAFVQIFAHRASGRDAPAPPPDTFGAYANKGQESTGVIAMIDLLAADLDKEMTEAETEEKNAQAGYETLMQDAAEKRAGDSTAITEKQGAKAGMEGVLQEAKEQQVTKSKELMATAEYTSNLHVECDWLLSNFDLRKTARADEIGALKNAKAVLSGADFTLMQRTSRTRSLRGH